MNVRCSSCDYLNINRHDKFVKNADTVELKNADILFSSPLIIRGFQQLSKYANDHSLSNLLKSTS